MENPSMPYLVWILDGNGSHALINLNQVRMIQPLEVGGCRAFFDPNFTVALSGPGGDTLLAVCMAHAKALDGVPVPEKLKGFIKDG